MAKLTIFIQPKCPFCVKALRYIEEARSAYPELQGVELEIVDELERTDYADEFDYYYVPTFYLGREKLHEGGIYADEVVEILKKANK